MPETKSARRVEAGIIDPTKVVRIALENASVLLLIEATLTEVPEPKGAERMAAFEGA